MTKSPVRSQVLLGASGLVLLAVASVTACSDTIPPPGTRHGACLPAGVCNEGLTCVDGVCVTAPADLAVAIDSAAPQDFAPPMDQLSTLDTAPAIDATAAMDLTVSPDFAPPPDLTALPDLAYSPPDLRGVDLAPVAWKFETVGTGEPLYAIYGLQGNVFAVGGAQFGKAGLIYNYTRNQGWKQQKTTDQDVYYAVWGSALNDLYVAGAAPSFGPPYIRHSANGGATWDFQPTFLDFTVHALGGGGGEAYAGGSFGGFLSTLNKGAKWGIQMFMNAPQINAVWWLGQGDVLVAGGGGLVERTPDGGRTYQVWNAGTNNALQAIWASGPDNVFIGGNDVLLRTGDLGKTLTPLTLPSRVWTHGIWGVSADVVYVVGLDLNTAKGAVYSTPDRGITWTPQLTNLQNIPRAVWASGPDGVFVACDGGVIARLP